MITFEPKEGLAIDPATGQAIQNTGCGDISLQTIGTAATVPNARTALGSPFKIRNVAQIGFFVDFTIGSLTSGSFDVEFSDSDDSAGVWSKDAVLDIDPATGICTVRPRVFTFTATGKFGIYIPNPAANFARAFTTSIGTVTGSSLALKYMRGWGNQSSVVV